MKGKKFSSFSSFLQQHYCEVSQLSLHAHIRKEDKTKEKLYNIQHSAWFHDENSIQLPLP